MSMKGQLMKKTQLLSFLVLACSIQSKGSEENRKESYRRSTQGSCNKDRLLNELCSRIEDGDEKLTSKERIKIAMQNIRLRDKERCSISNERQRGVRGIGLASSNNRINKRKKYNSKQNSGWKNKK